MPQRGVTVGRAIAQSIEGATESLRSADAVMRPRDPRGVPGALVYLPRVEYVVIVPDLHARGDFLRAVAAARFQHGAGTVEDDLAAGIVAVICVGDAFHSEVRARERWKAAYREFLNGYACSPAMDAEMAESLDALHEVARLQTSYPRNFHFLKGNHENIANERKEGNFPFRKFAYEGEMVREWILNVSGPELFDAIYRWEKALPLAAAGNRILVAHAEPVRALSPRDIIDAYMDPDIIVGLTWTENGQASPGSVAETLSAFFPGDETSLMFGGHRPVPGRYSLRQEGRYVQINTPDNRVVAAFRSGSDFVPQRDIIDLEKTDGDRYGENS